MEAGSRLNNEEPIVRKERLYFVIVLLVTVVMATGLALRWLRKG